MNDILVPLLRRLDHACVIGRLQNKVILYHITREPDFSLTNSAAVGYRACTKPTSVLARQTPLACSCCLLETFADCSGFSTHVRELTACMV